MKLITTLSMTAMLSIVSVSAYASAQDAFQSRFSSLYELSKSSKHNPDVFNENPWCGYKGAPGTPNSPPTPGATYPDFKTGKTATNAPPTIVELKWLNGLKSATDKKAYVDANQQNVSYQMMGKSLTEGSLHCAARAISNEKNNASSKHIIRQKYASSVLNSASVACKNYPAYETQLKKEAEDLKHDADKFKDKTCPECFVAEGQKLKDREKDLKKKQETAGLMFQNCVSNYSQLFVNPASIYVKR